MKSPFTETSVPINIPVIENHYKARFIGDLPLKGRDYPCAIFYQENPPNNFSNYFAIFVRNNKIYITSAKEIVDTPRQGVITKNKEIVYSKYHHDFHFSSDGIIAVDGGAEYLRLSGNPEDYKVVRFIPNKDKLIIKEQINNENNHSRKQKLR